MAKRGHGEGGVCEHKTGKWCAYLTVNGKRRWWYAETQAGAWAKLTDARRARARGELRQTRLTVQEYLADWLERIEPSPRTLRNYRDAVKQIVPHLGHYRLSELKRTDIEDCYAALKKRYAPATIKLAHATLHRALRDAADHELIYRNPADRAQTPRIVTPEVRPLTREQVRALCDVSRSTQWHALWMLLATTGIRVGEAMALTWKDIDKEVRVTHTLHYARDARRGDPKSRSGRRSVPLTASMLAALEDHRRIQRDLRLYYADIWTDTDYVLSSIHGKPLAYSTVRKAFLRALDSAGISRDVTPHTLRHTFASVCFERGVHPGKVQHWMGHSSSRVTQDLYSHMMPGMSDELVELMEDVLKSPTTTVVESV
jgi:integrase